MSERILEDTKRRALLVAAMLSSDKAGEVANAVSSLNRLLPGGLTVERMVVEAIEGLTVSTLATGGPAAIDLRAVPSGGWLRCPWVGKARDCLAFPDLFDARQVAFLASMATRRDAPTPKQAEWLDALHASVRETA